jgi:NAD(P)-dependent dehydrogenase (short-subunit alcohol dehydrogenase family)
LTPSLPWKTVWITGASTGIGREIALQLAAAGLNVAASARSKEKLAGLGANVRAYPLDVTDAEGCAATIAAIERDLGPIDLAVLGAGTFEPMTLDTLSLDNFHRTMETNYMGVVNALAALVPLMRGRGQGHLAWIASVAGYRGLPKAAAYGPSKAALINLAESLKPELQVFGVKVSVINPGFVETPMTAQNKFPMPFLMKPEDAARQSIAGLVAGKFEIAFPFRFVAFLKIARILPYSWYFGLIRRFVLGK